MMMYNTFIVSAIFWVLALVVYHITLKQLTFHHLNRYYLLLSLLLGFALPFIPLPVVPTDLLTVYLEPVVIPLNGVVTTPATPDAATTASNIRFLDLLPLIYIVGVLWMLLRLARAVYQLYSQTQNVRTVEQTGLRIFSSPAYEQPHSFMNWMFVPDYTTADPMLIQHEYAHIKGGHSYDKLLLQLLQAFYWFIPVFGFYRRNLNEVHEYIADAYVIKHTSKKRYSYFLLGQTGLGVTPLLSNNFHSLIKNRINMMLKQKSSAQQAWRYVPVLSFMLIAAAFIAFSCEQQAEEIAQEETKQLATTELQPNLVEIVDTVTTFDPKTFEETVSIVKHEMEVYDELEQMPMFSVEGCEGKTADDLDDCASMNLLNFIFSNIEYPTAEPRKEGIVIVKFIVDKEGNAISPKIVKTIDKDYSHEVYRMFNKLQRHKWIPGTLNGEPKSVYLSLPIKFVLTE